VYGEPAALKFLETFKELPIETIDTITDPMLQEASRFKTSYRISVADSFALATAFLYEGKLVTSDHHEFDAIEKDNKLNFHWIR
jgi:predicted nucleic acid-binding protein